MNLTNHISPHLTNNYTDYPFWGLEEYTDTADPLSDPYGLLTLVDEPPPQKNPVIDIDVSDLTLSDTHTDWLEELEIAMNKADITAPKFTFAYWHSPDDIEPTPELDDFDEYEFILMDSHTSEQDIETTETIVEESEFTLMDSHGDVSETYHFRQAIPPVTESESEPEHEEEQWTLSILDDAMHYEVWSVNHTDNSLPSETEVANDYQTVIDPVYQSSTFEFAASISLFDDLTLEQ